MENERGGNERGGEQKKEERERPVASAHVKRVRPTYLVSKVVGEQEQMEGHL